MFRVTPVPENGPRKVSFSPDIDESYRHQVVDKIQGLMKEVEVIHEKEETQLRKIQETQRLEFQQKQELELKAFMKKQQEQKVGFQSQLDNGWNDLKEKHTQETWKLFGRASTRPDMSSRPTIHSMWDQQGKKNEDSRHSSPCFSPQTASETSNHSWNSVPNSQVTSPTPWPTHWDQTNGGQQSNGGVNRGLNFWN